jgi:rhodanese-related sulfurtransferase
VASRAPPYDRHVPLDRLREEMPKLFRKDAALVVYGADEASTEAAASELERLGFSRPIRIPGGFGWFKQRGWDIETGPGSLGPAKARPD